MTSNRNKIPSHEITNSDFIKISRDNKTLLYKESANGNWLPLLKISQVNSTIISYLLPWLQAQVFTGVALTPDKNKLIITVCDEVEYQSDFAEEWSLLFDLHNRSIINIPGNSLVRFSESHQLAFITKVNLAIPGPVSIYAIDLNTGEVLLSYNLQYDH